MNATGTIIWNDVSYNQIHNISIFLLYFMEIPGMNVLLNRNLEVEDLTVSTLFKLVHYGSFNWDFM